MNRSFLVLSGMLALMGCMSGCTTPKVLPSRSHAPSSPDGVKIFEKPPAEYEVLDTLTLVMTDEYQWDDRGDATALFERMKVKAAALGANGLLLALDKSMSDMLALANYRDQRYWLPIRVRPEKTAVGQAIFVVKE